MLLGLVFALILAEGVLRVFPGLLPEDAQLRIHWSEMLASREITSIGHPDLGFVYPPDHQEEIRHGEVAFTYTTDAKGFRNTGSWPNAADIVVVGDSLTFSYGVQDDEGWIEMLSERLPQMRLLNLGLIGAAPQQYLRIYREFGRPLRPDLLIVGLFPGNDLTDAALFSQWLAAGSPGNYDVWRFFRGRVPGRRRGLKGLLEGSYLVTLVNEMRKNSTSPFSSQTIELSDGSRLRLAPGVRAGNAARAKPDSPEFRRVIATLQEARRLCEEDGTQLLVLLFPTKEEVYLPLLNEPTPEAVRPFVTELERLGIPILDLTPGFQEVARDDIALYFEVDGHPNAAGYRLVADIVYEHLRDNAKTYGLAE